MTQTLAPRDERDLVEIVADAHARRTPLAVEGHGTRRSLGQPVEVSSTLSLAGLTGITLYEPAELVLSARAGTPLEEIEAALAACGQELAFEPIDHSTLFGHAPRAGTVGGMVAVNACGPRRLKVGAARDHLLGFRAVNGLAEPFKSGGRVMKNVTGFDLSKLVAGSFGTLAVMTEVTLKVLPRAETEETLAILGLDDEAAGRLMREASGLPQEVSCLAHLPARPHGLFPETAATLLRLEGPAVSVASREADLFARWRDLGPIEILGEDASRALWADVREAGPVAEGDDPIWRLSVAPSEGPALVARLREHDLPITRWFYDWAGGLVWLAIDSHFDMHDDRIRSDVDHVGGHAFLVRAPLAARHATPTFHPQPAPLAALAARVKAAFDPAGIFEPGRMSVRS